MARSLLKANIHDKAGNVIVGAKAYVYENETTTPVADLFSSKSGGVAQTTLTSNSKGDVRGWINDPRPVRLRVTDNDGTATYSDLTVVPFDTFDIDDVPVYENPLNDVTDVGEFPVGNYDTIVDAVAAATAAGGGLVRLAPGANPVSAKLSIPSQVVVSGPEGFVWSVWGYNADPRVFHTCWLEADGSTSDPVVEFAAGVVNAGLRNVMVYGGGHGRDGVVVADDPTTRGGIRVDNVYAHGCNIGFYFGAIETRTDILCAMANDSHGVDFEQQDCKLFKATIGYNGGDGLVLGPNAGPIRAGTIDTFFNVGTGLRIQSSGHKIAQLQTQSNGKEGVVFEDCGSVSIVHIEAEGNGTSGVYPDVHFAAAVGGNGGCEIIGGWINGTDVASHAVATTEAVPQYPQIIGVHISGSFAGGDAGSSGTSPFARMQPLTSFNIRGCFGVPDVVVPQGGVPTTFRPNGSQDIVQVQDGSGTVFNATKAGGAHYQRTTAQALVADGAVTINAATTNQHAVTLEANATSCTITNPTTGQVLTISFIQDATGSRTYAWPTDCRFAAATAPTPSSAADLTDTVTFRYSGSVWKEISRSIGVG